MLVWVDLFEIVFRGLLGSGIWFRLFVFWLVGFEGCLNCLKICCWLFDVLLWDAWFCCLVCWLLFVHWLVCWFDFCVTVLVACFVCFDIDVICLYSVVVLRFDWWVVTLDVCCLVGCGCFVVVMFALFCCWFDCCGWWVCICFIWCLLQLCW